MYIDWILTSGLLLGHVRSAEEEHEGLSDGAIDGVGEPCPAEIVEEFEGEEKFLQDPGWDGAVGNGDVGKGADGDFSDEELIVLGVDVDDAAWWKLLDFCDSGLFELGAGARHPERIVHLNFARRHELHVGVQEEMSMCRTNRFCTTVFFYVPREESGRNDRMARRKTKKIRRDSAKITFTLPRFLQENSFGGLAKRLTSCAELQVDDWGRSHFVDVLHENHFREDELLTIVEGHDDISLLHRKCLSVFYVLRSWRSHEHCAGSIDTGGRR